MSIRAICKIASITILLAVFLVLVPHPSFAQSTGFDTGRTYEVYAYGSGNYLATLFNGIAMITSGGLIHSLVKIALLLALVYGLLVSVSNFIGAGSMSKGGGGEIYRGEGFSTIISIAITALIAVGIFLSPRATVSIIDRVDPTQTQVIGNVPLPSAFIPHMMSTIGDTIGKEFEMVFSLPDALQFRNGGIALGAKYTDALMNIYPPNSSTPNLDSYANLTTAGLREFFTKCVFPNYGRLNEGDPYVGSQAAALAQMTQTDDLMAHLSSSIYFDPNITVYNMPNDSGVATCTTAMSVIDAAWTASYGAWERDIEMKLSGNAGLSGISGAGNSLNLGTGALTTAVTDRYFPNATIDKMAILKTIATANLMRDSIDTYLAYMGSPTTNALVAAKRSSSAGWLTAAKFFNTIVHTITGNCRGAHIRLVRYAAIVFRIRRPVGHRLLWENRTLAANVGAYLRPHKPLR